MVLFIHGDSFSWGSGNLYDGDILAAYSDVVVVTINYRLGVLGECLLENSIKRYHRLCTLILKVNFSKLTILKKI